MRRLIFLRHAPTASTRRAAFGADEPLDDQGRAAAAALVGRLAPRAQVYASPAMRAIDTARLAGHEPDVAQALAECDFGAWKGRLLADVADEDPDGVTAWMTDPAAAPHGGESLIALLARVGGWMEDQAALDGAALAVSHAGPIRAAVVHALGAPLAALWRIDVAPLSLTELHCHDGRWRLVHLNVAA